MKPHFLLFMLSVFAHFTLFAQSEKMDRGYFTVGAGYGALSFKGDLGKNQKLTSFNNFKGGFNFNVEKRFGKIFAVGFNGLIGKLAQNEYAATINRNFESPLRQFGLNLSAQFDTKPESQFAPFISVGVSSISFSPSSDLKDKNGKTYYYWEKGEIRDRPYSKQDADSAQKLVRDYTYETPIAIAGGDSSALKKSAIAIPLTLGLKFKMGQRTDARLAATYNFTQTDYIDGYVNGRKDSYLYLSMGLFYTFMKKNLSASETAYENIDFAALLKEDQDDDGVTDDIDQCQRTPNGVQVDQHGCPQDTDNDGVADYVDREKDTKPGAIVNQYGVTMTDEMIALLRAYRDSVVPERVSHFYDAPSKETLKDIDKQISQKQSSTQYSGISAAIPKTYQFADKDGNSIISSSEITAAIDAFFEGELDINIQTLLGLIDYYFEQ